MRTITECTPRQTRIGDLEVTVCPDCRTVEWRGPDRVLDPAEGMARLFGSFDLEGRLPGLRAPGPEVLAYRPPSRRARRRLEALPAHLWVEAAPDLWASHDGNRLLLSPTRPLLLRNLTREEDRDRR